MKAAPKQHLSVLIADFRQLALDCRKALAIFPGADQWSESNNLLLLSLETAIELLESGLPMPLIVARGASGVGKTAFLNSICDHPVGEPSWKRPATVETTARISGDLRECAGVASLMDKTRILLEPKIGWFAGVVDTPDVDHLGEDSRSVVSGWTQVADMVLWISTPQRFQDDSGERWAAANKLLESPVVFVLSHLDDCVEGEAEAILRAWIVELAMSGYGNPVVFAIPRDGAKIRDWLRSELNPEVLDKIRLKRISNVAIGLSVGLESGLSVQSGMDFQEIRGEWRCEIGVEAEHLAEAVMEGLDARRFDMEALLEADLHARLRGIMAFWLKYVAGARSGNGFLAGGWRAIIGQVAWGHQDQKTRRDQTTRLALEPAFDAIKADKRREDLSMRLRSVLVSRGLPLECVEVIFSTPENMSWRDQLLGQARTVLEEFENKRLSSGGIRGLVRETVLGIANYLPPLCLLAILSWPVILFFDPMGWKRTPQWIDLFLPAACLVLVLFAIQALLGMVMPFQWSSIRAELKQRLQAVNANEMEREFIGFLDAGFARLEQASSSMRDVVERAGELAKRASRAAEDSRLVARIMRGKPKI